MWSTWLVFVAVTGVVIAEPLAPCEKSGQPIADSDSCTRYHICRLEDGQFNTDIAICSADKLFDVGEAKCVPRGSGYVPNPNSCTKFYGCQPPSNNKGEGLIRKTYECTGELRFDPDLGQCTYKVLVPDAKCNNGVSNQQILGQQITSSSTSCAPGSQSNSPSSSSASSSSSSSNSNSGDDNSSSSASTSSSGSSNSPSGSNNPSSTSNSPSSSSSSTSANNPSTSATANNNPTSSNNPSSSSSSSTSNNPSASNSNDNPSPSTGTEGDTAGGQGGGTRLAGGVALPESEVSDLERIAQVIKGQLLNRNRGGSLLNKKVPASSRL